MRARLMVRGRARSPKIGIFESGSHRVVDIPNCGVHHPLINEVAREVKSVIHAYGLSPYSDERHEGLVRSLQVVVEQGAVSPDPRAQVVVVTNDDSIDSAAPMLAALAEQLQPHLHSLFWNGQPERSNTIIGPLWGHLHGPSMLEGVSGGATVFYPPGAFGQANTAMAGALVRRLHQWIPVGARVAEFYAGVGTIGLGLVERAEFVRFNEIGVHSIAGLRRGIESLPASGRTKTTVVEGEAGKTTQLLDGCDTTIVDPPRRGLDPPLRDALANWSGQRLVYVSCGIDSFLADAQLLIDAGRWRLIELAAFGFFPFTEHVETLARFERRSR